MAEIHNTKSNTLLSGTKKNDTILNGGSWYEERSRNNSENNEGDIDEVQAPNFYKGGDKVTIYGGAGNDAVVNYYGSNVSINSDAGNDEVYNYQGDPSIFSGGALFNDDFDKYTSSAKINTGAGNDSVENTGDSVTVDTGAGNDSVENYGSKVTISGGKGNDTIYNDWNKEKNTQRDVSFGNGKNVLFKYSSGDGNDKIYGFKSNSTLSIDGGSYSTKKSGDNIIVTVGNGKISLIGAASLSKVNIKGTKYTSTTLTVTDKTKSPVSVGSAIKTINATSRTKEIKITGNSLANTIRGGSGKDTIYGGAGNDSIVGNAGNDKLYGQAGNDKLRGGKGNDSLWGGAGNDSLWGGSGNDTFIYKAGEGTDKIFDYTSGDMLKILKSNGKTGSFSKSKFSGGTLSLTISGGGQVIFNDVAKGDKFNINGTTYKISGSKLK